MSTRMLTTLVALALAGEAMLAGGQAWAQATIGPKDGTSYQVLWSRTIHETAVQCGYNDAGAPNIGEYVEEGRRYETWSNGQMVRTWEQTVKTFVRCGEGP